MGSCASNRTPGGYRCDECASAMQKSIRRGLERDSLYWATELDLAGYGDYVWRRLRVIASEDVGMADPNVAVQVRALSENYREMREHNRKSHQHEKGRRPGERLFLLQAVVVLVRAPKSRMIDHLVMVMYEGDRAGVEMPDWALDKHTSAGKNRGRGLDHFFAEGAALSNEVDVGDVYAEEAREARHRHEGG